MGNCVCEHEGEKIMNRHERRKGLAIARYRFGTKHGSPKLPLAVQDKIEADKAKKRKRLLMTKAEKQAQKK
jgi:hypothetical protein